MKFLHKFNFTEDYYKHVYTFNGGGSINPNIPNIMLDASRDDVHYSTATESEQVVPSDYVRLDYIKNAASGLPAIETSAIDMSKYSIVIEYSEDKPANGYLLYSPLMYIYRACYYTGSNLMSWISYAVRNTAGSTLFTRTLYNITKNKAYPSRRRLTIGIKSDSVVSGESISEGNIKWNAKVEDLDSNSTAVNYQNDVNSEFLNYDFSSHKFVVFARTTNGGYPFYGNLYSLKFIENERAIPVSETSSICYYPVQNINTGTIGLIERKETSQLSSGNPVVEYAFKQSTSSGTYAAGPIYEPELN